MAAGAATDQPDQLGCSLSEAPVSILRGGDTEDTLFGTESFEQVGIRQETVRKAVHQMAGNLTPEEEQLLSLVLQGDAQLETIEGPIRHIFSAYNFTNPDRQDEFLSHPKLPDWHPQIHFDSLPPLDAKDIIHINYYGAGVRSFYLTNYGLQYKI